MVTLRSLKIKASTCKRLVRELRSYEEEVEKEAAKTTGMKEEGADPYDLKQQAELKVSNEHGVEIEEAESTIREVEPVLTPIED
uniref:Tubulin-specific chaperone A n=1 Tax=Leersia perrieri TaxID=77586 RepID=A0A0D9VH89_9ORYZ